MKIELSGNGVSRGVAIGRARLYQTKTPKPLRRRILESDVEAERGRLDTAIEASKGQLLRLIRRHRNKNEDASGILEMQLALLDDPGLFGVVSQHIGDESLSAEESVHRSLQEARAQFAKITDDSFRERGKDIQDVGKRVLNNLMGVLGESLEELDEPVILIAHDLSPSDTASIPTDMVLGFATEVGGPTSHTAILARSLKIAAVVGVGGLTHQIRDGDLIILDGFSGSIVVGPDEETEAQYRRTLEAFSERESRIASLAALPAVTVDGQPVQLLANIELPAEVGSVLKSGADGIGLYRTEYLFMGRTDLPSEEEQYQAYRSAAEGLKGRPVVIRTLDIGGDKFAHALSMAEELNPFLGWRAIRFCLQNIDIFRAQLRAILRAAAHGNIRLLYPLLSGVSELRQVSAVLEDVKRELLREKVEHDPDILVGGMIEVPSAVMMIERLADGLSFFSIGTNDLIQYTLAVDRGNAKIAHLYEPLHPAVLKMIAEVVRVGHENRIPVELCGEMASDPLCALVLIALGVQRLSMSPVAIPSVKAVVRQLGMDQVHSLGKRVVEIPTADQVRDYASRVAKRLLPQFPWDM